MVQSILVWNSVLKEAEDYVVIIATIFEKWGGTILKLLFGGCFTKHLVLGTRKMENGFSVRRNGALHGMF